ncbi:YeeE/YedE thiosulfate transporter family protein [Rhodohalobacter sp. 614A]|uniref:YeeE/YedE thiosulfate transporter family protein n=1 Tax=Rhodohalobacter sp. 614A TaxID=2908649 RepID=UPI001F1F4AB1|nr:YeeE/YedE thiosulfate transporter family protein [Rhodohalobacter sp. 614A]
MAPLVPEILSSEFNLVVAFIVGIAFGFALEQAGFSSSRKLVGLFYGYDFTVLKVFFTAGVTAMVGVLLFAHLGLLDLNVIYINPTFLWSALVGGAIMGVGFILGGFCPGTSLCALAVGRIDAFAFVGGSILGILAFTEGYPMLETLFNSTNMGPLTMNDMLGISPEFFGILLTIIALLAFYLTSKIEDKVNGKTIEIPRDRKIKYSLTAVLPIVIITLIWMTPDKKEYTLSKMDSAQISEVSNNFDTMTIDKLAFEIMNNVHEFNIIDIRDTTAYKEASIPAAINVPFENLYNREWRSMLKQPYKTNVFIGDDMDKVYKAAFLARELGDTDPVILESPVVEFREVIFNAVEPIGDVSKTDLTRYKFHIEAAERLTEIEERLKNSLQPPKKEIKRVQGGCT